jgi:hypothetical protein
MLDQIEDWKPGVVENVCRLSLDALVKSKFMMSSALIVFADLKWLSMDCESACESFLAKVSVCSRWAKFRMITAER